MTDEMTQVSLLYFLMAYNTAVCAGLILTEPVEVMGCSWEGAQQAATVRELVRTDNVVVTHRK